MEELAVKIAEGNKMVYLLQGSEEMKDSLMKAVGDYAGGTADLPRVFIIPGDYKEAADESGEVEDLFLDLITVRILMADYFFIHVRTPKGMSGSRIKELVHGDFFSQYYYLIRSEKMCPKQTKLIVVSTANYEGSIFYTEAALKARCEFL